jgi:hypothetical protein
MNENLKYRLGGIALILGGLVVGYWGIFSPFQSALHGAAEVHYYTKIFILVPMMLVFGFFFTAFGNSIAYRNAEQQKFTAVGWVLFTAVTLISAASFFGLKSQFAALGYTG